MYCGNCGMPLAFGKTECSICGFENNEDNNRSNNKKSNKGLIIGIIIAVILIPIIILGVIFIMGISKTSGVLSESKTKTAISYYNTVEKQVRIKYAMGENIICDDNCNVFFGIQSSDFEIEVDSRGSDYELTLEFEEHFLDNGKLNQKSMLLS